MKKNEVSSTSSLGPNTLQGPHHSALQSSINGLVAFSTRVEKFASVILSVEVWFKVENFRVKLKEAKESFLKLLHYSKCNIKHTWEKYSKQHFRNSFSYKRKNMVKLLASCKQ